MFPSRQISFVRDEITPCKICYYSAGTVMMNILIAKEALQGLVQHFYGIVTGRKNPIDLRVAVKSSSSAALQCIISNNRI